MEKIRVIISNQQKAVKIPTGIRMLIRRCCHAVLQLEGFKDSAEISVSFVDNDQIQEMNRQYRNIDAPTDVLSFPMGENGNYDVNHETGAKILGDIVISVPKAMEQAKTYGHSFEREMGFLTAHSMLHLLGYDHEAGGLARVRMRERGGAGHAGAGPACQRQLRHHASCITPAPRKSGGCGTALPMPSGALAAASNPSGICASTWWRAPMCCFSPRSSPSAVGRWPACCWP